MPQRAFPPLLAFCLHLLPAAFPPSRKIHKVRNPSGLVFNPSGTKATCAKKVGAGGRADGNGLGEVGGGRGRRRCGQACVVFASAWHQAWAGSCSLGKLRQPHLGVSRARVIICPRLGELPRGSDHACAAFAHQLAALPCPAAHQDEGGKLTPSCTPCAW